MSLIRIQPVMDPASRRFYLEIYSPHDAEQPFVTTAPRYQSEAAAEADVVAIIAAAASGARGDG